MIAIIDYGMGNLHSVEKGFEKAGCPAFITDDSQKVSQAPGIVLPGVGAFADAMDNLSRTGFIEVLKEAVQAEKPVLGICLGMQLLFRESEENGLYTGLNLLPGRVIKFNLPSGWKVPHMGWNQIKKMKDSSILKGINSGIYYYFVHSYYVAPEDLSLVAASSQYGVDFSAVVEKGNVFGIQFHPEKSSDYGLKILKNFGELVYR
ncbi:MAG: imidazole glycerol phosphate synthase subunit HisH [Desulfitobacteriaceae bacterium]|nr:imidazole glycerol phosphate synthase subunit HisH [Desulfitobacteriaceae bacterium]